MKVILRNSGTNIYNLVPVSLNFIRQRFSYSLYETHENLRLKIFCDTVTRSLETLRNLEAAVKILELNGSIEWRLSLKNRWQG